MNVPNGWITAAVIASVVLVGSLIPIVVLLCMGGTKVSLMKQRLFQLFHVLLNLTAIGVAISADRKEHYLVRDCFIGVAVMGFVNGIVTVLFFDPDFVEKNCRCVRRARRISARSGGGLSGTARGTSGPLQPAPCIVVESFTSTSPAVTSPPNPILDVDAHQGQEAGGPDESGTTQSPSTSSSESSSSSASLPQPTTPTTTAGTTTASSTCCSGGTLPEKGLPSYAEAVDMMTQ